MAESSKQLPVREANGEPVATTTPNLVLDEVTGERVSKSEYKKRIKAREVERRKAEKAAAAPPKPTKKVSAEEGEKELTPNQYFEIRSRTVDALRKTKNPNPYPHKFNVTDDLRQFVEKYKDLERGAQLQDVEVSIGARIYTKRSSGEQSEHF
jgi:lysyl-tRNA synthetase, class II